MTCQIAVCCSESLEVHNMKLSAEVDDITSQKQGVERQLQGLQKQHTEKTKEFTTIQQKHADLLSNYQILEKSSHMHQKKVQSSY